MAMKVCCCIIRLVLLLSHPIEDFAKCAIYVPGISTVNAIVHFIIMQDKTFRYDSVNVACIKNNSGLAFNGHNQL